MAYHGICSSEHLGDDENGSFHPTDEQLITQLVHGLYETIGTEKEEKCWGFTNSVAIPNPLIRRLAKLLVDKCELQIPDYKIDEWIFQSRVFRERGGRCIV